MMSQPNLPRFVAEVSSNHHQDLDRCLQFIDKTSEIGCTAVKFQLFKIEQLFAPEILEKSEEHRRRKAWELPESFLPHLAACPTCPVGCEAYSSGVAPVDGTGVKNIKSLAERTVEDVLLHFGETKKVARRRYRDFVKKGIDQGARKELQGGGLVRSASGHRADLLGRKKEDREKGDERILGSGDFVNEWL